LGVMEVVIDVCVSRKAGTDSLKVDGVAKVLSREAEFQLGQ
jgi:hypothetical protein